MNEEKVLELAKLARIKISPEEAKSLSHEFDSILDYVGQIKNMTPPLPSPKLGEGLGRGLHNIMREDGEGHESGIYTERLLAEAPVREGDYVQVKKIL